MLITLMALATAAPLELTWQTRLSDASGEPITGATVVEIELWTAETNGTELWDDTFTIDFDGGYGSVRLGSGDPLTTDVFAGGDLWVQHRVNNAVLGSRQQLASVPYAIQADSVPVVAATDDADCTGQAGRITWDTNAAALKVCDGTLWKAVVMGSTLVSQGGARQYSDGGVAASCNAYIDPGPGNLYVGDTGDGLYWIDPDGAGPGTPFQAYCDMTTNGGGWTQLHMLDDRDALGLVFADQNTCGDTSTTASVINSWGFGTIITSGDPAPGSDNCYSVDGSGSAPEQRVFEIPFYTRDGAALSGSQVSALAAITSTTVYDGHHYHNDIDAPGISEPVGPYGETGTGPVNDGGGGYVIFPSKSSNPATGADFYITDNNNPHNVTGGATDNEAIDWQVIGHGLITHFGVQGRGNDVNSAMTWSGPDATGGGRGVLTHSWLWVR